jgi:hypothetical protein
MSNHSQQKETIAMRPKGNKQHQTSTWLRLKYWLACALETPFGDAFWLFHQWAVRLQDRIEGRGDK